MSPFYGPLAVVFVYAWAALNSRNCTHKSSLTMPSDIANHREQEKWRLERRSQPGRSPKPGGSTATRALCKIPHDSAESANGEGGLFVPDAFRQLGHSPSVRERIRSARLFQGSEYYRDRVLS